LCSFHEIFRVSGPLHGPLIIRFSWGAFSPKFSAPPSCDTLRWIRKRFGKARTARTYSTSMPSLTVLGLRTPSEDEKVPCFSLFFPLTIKFVNANFAIKVRNNRDNVEQAKVCRCAFAFNLIIVPLGDDTRKC